MSDANKRSKGRCDYYGGFADWFVDVLMFWGSNIMEFIAAAILAFLLLLGGAFLYHWILG